MLKINLNDPMTNGVVTHCDEFSNNDVKDYGLRLIVKQDDDNFFVVKYHKLNDGSCYEKVKSMKFWARMDFDLYIKHNGPISEEKEVPGLSLHDYVNDRFTQDHDAAVELGTKVPDRSLSIVTNTHSFVNMLNAAKNQFAYDSIYTSPEGAEHEVNRIAFATSMPQNAVLKFWSLDLKSKVSLKFDETSISKMAEEWNMEKTVLVDEDYDILSAIQRDEQFNLIVSEAIQDQMDIRVKGMPIDSLGFDNAKYLEELQEQQEEDESESQEQDSNSAVKTAEVKPLLKKDRIFNFRDVDLELFIINERAVIVFQLKYSNQYILWDIKGKEDHRLVVSAKGPFDNTLEVLDGKAWNLFAFEQDEFLSRIDMTKEQVVRLFATYSTSWMLNVQEVHITTVQHPGGK